MTALVLLAALHIVPTLASASADDLRPLVVQARRGAVRGAVTTLMGWPVERQIAASEGAALEGADLRAAVLLYTELASLQMFMADKSQRNVGRKIAERLSDRLGSPELERRRTLALGYWYQEWGDLDDARGYYRRYDDDAEALLALGTVYEQIHTIGRGWGGFGDTRQPLDTAAHYYERAIEARPDYAEAALRLARVGQLQGRTQASRDAFARLLAGRPRPEIAGYAHLFLGEIAQDEDHLQAAIEQYRLAIAADPLLQPAHLSLSQALHQAGRIRESARVMLDGLHATSGRPLHGWFGYFATAIHGYRLSMDALWDEVGP